ncbi:MAG: alanine--tRNA ligase [Candidatus Aminicenantes bacterium]|nr:MAG: alanine--tRNA ligase [Candidatus Aminicenantes bacterium]
MKSQEIRETFLDFFAEKNHKIIKSSSLLPKDDPTILFTNAGMNQFKNTFLGLEKRSYKRAASVQKCMRVSGKHNDLEQVGKTSKHHTFFEMLGNFSFGDYFKKEAIEYAWELIVEVFKLKKENVYATVYEEDDEAYKIWNETIGISSERIFRFGKKDNYWAMGETGPCGPCSEIHYDLGSEIEEGDPYPLIEKGSDRFSELWNLVFMQFHQDEKGTQHPLPSPSIDTGMGLERLAVALQGLSSNFDTDLFHPLIQEVCDIAGREYPSHDEGDIAVRIIADHIRAVSFLISDGIMPSNEGRGYVLRRLIRRAFRQGNSIEIEEPFLYKLVGVVCDIMKDAYPELLPSANYVSKVCQSEEKRFALTLSSGLRTFNQYIKEAKKAGKKVLSGAKAFKLYDTYGFPLDLSKELAEEQHMDVAEKDFHHELEKQRERARRSWEGEERQKGKKVYEQLKSLSVEYVGYEQEKIPEAKVTALLRKDQIVQELKEGETGEIFLDKTPFYAEAGGQTGDSGILKSSHFAAVVESAFYPTPDLISHKVKVISGKIRVNDKVEAAIDVPNRRKISNNHTATHLLHASLRQILGDHVKQAGSLVESSRLRFDFTHFAALSSAELEQIELLVNEKIREGIEVETKVTTLEKGLEEGAVAIFEEKYGEKIRMVTIGDFSKELCGGVHVHSTAQIGLFKIIAESSIAAGMRRIEALTGEEALKRTQETEELLIDVQTALNSPRTGLLNQIEKLKESVKSKERETKAIRQKMAKQEIKGKEEDIRKIKGISVLVQKVKGLNNTELRELADSLKQKIGSGVVVLGAASGKKVFLVTAVTKDCVARLKADELVKEIASRLDGGGGGRPDFAQAGGTKPEQLEKVLEESYTIIEKMIS